MKNIKNIYYLHPESGAKFRWVLAMVALVVLLLIVGCGKNPPTASTGVRPAPEVGVLTIQPQPAEIITELPGRTTAYRVAEVRPQVGGILRRRLFTEGSEVKAGQQLYQIDPSTYEAAAASQEAAVMRAEAGARVAKLLVDRREKLANSSVISRQDYDDAYAAYQQALADVATAKAALRTARIDINYTKVLSPISGRIGRSMVTEGALVTANQSTALATVQQLDPIYVDVTQSSAQLLRLQRELANGQLTTGDGAATKVRLILEDGTEFPEVGKLQFSEVAVDPGTGSVTLRAEFPNPRCELLPGMFVRTLVNEGVQSQALLVPQKGVSRNPRGEPVAMVIGEGYKIEARILRTNRTVGNQWLVTEGIKPGDRVVLEGLQKIAPGVEVKPVEMEPGK